MTRPYTATVETYLAPRTCARQIDRSRGHIYDLIADGRLKAVRIAGVLRVPASAWGQYLTENVRPVESDEIVEGAAR